LYVGSITTRLDIDSSSFWSLVTLFFRIEIIAKIKKPPPLLRPSVSKQTAPPDYINSMKQCWAEQAETRPSFNDLAQSIKLLNGGK
jgi:hypothetical protein